MIRFVFVVLVLLAWTAQAAETKKDPKILAEEKEAKAEEDAEALLDRDSLQRQFQGKVLLFPDGVQGERTEIVGTFVCGGNTYYLKLAAPELISALKRVNGSNAMLEGKIRNAGKYFVVLNVGTPGAPIYERRKRGGI